MRRPFAFLIVVAALALPARPARADLASSFYDDVHDVVEELIQTEITTSVVTQIEARSPALAFYLHGTLERLGSPYWGSLGRALKDDLTVVVSDFVYWHLSTGGGDGDVVASARTFFRCVAQGAGGPGGDGCTRLNAAVRGQHRPLLEVECRRAKPPAERRVACDIGLAVKSAMERRGEVRHHVVDALADIVLAEIPQHDLTERLRDVLVHWLDLPKDLPTPLLEAMANPDLVAQLADDAVDALCKDPKTIDAALHDPASGRAWICFAVTHPALPDALAVTVHLEEGPEKLDGRVEYWRVQAALKDVDPDRITDDTAARLLGDLALDDRCPPGGANTDWPCKGTRLGAGTKLTITWLGVQTEIAADAHGLLVPKQARQLLVGLLRFRKLVRRIDELRALVPPSLAAYLFYAGTTPKDARAVLRSFTRMARLVTELRSRWYLWTESKPDKDKAAGFEDLDVAELLHVAQNAVSAIRDTEAGAAAARVGDEQLASSPVQKSLAFLDKHAAGGAANLDIGDWLRMVMRGDYRALAMESLRAALDLELADASRPRETFFLTLAAYLLDSSDGGGGENIARSAFRAAAKDLLLSQSHVGVPRVGDRFRFRLLPRLALKIAFNDVYAVTDGNSRRSVVSADWPTAMLAITDYAGLEASIVDPLAPLAEMALRPPGVYHDYAYVAFDALRPRLGAWVAVPQLSRRLTISTGFGARFLDVRRNTPPDALTLDATYSFKASLTFDAGLQFVF